MSELKELLTVRRDRKLLFNNARYPDALDMIRCGIGANYGGEYYEEVIKAVLEPIKKEIERLNNLDNKGG